MKLVILANIVHDEKLKDSKKIKKKNRRVNKQNYIHDIIYDTSYACPSTCVNTKYACVLSKQLKYVRSLSKMYLYWWSDHSFKLKI